MFAGGGRARPLRVFPCKWTTGGDYLLFFVMRKSIGHSALLRELVQVLRRMCFRGDNKKGGSFREERYERLR
jgi:hypothetical protein